MNYCPCCSDTLLKHIRHSEIYWFCRTCWQEMPLFIGDNSQSLSQAIFKPTLAPIQKKVGAIYTNKRKSMAELLEL